MCPHAADVVFDSERRNERQLMEQLNYNLLFRCFMGLNHNDPRMNS